MFQQRHKISSIYMSDQVTRGDLKEANPVEQVSEMSEWQECLSTFSWF